MKPDTSLTFAVKLYDLFLPHRLNMIVLQSLLDFVIAEMKAKYALFRAACSWGFFFVNYHILTADLGQDASCDITTLIQTKPSFIHVP